MNCTDKVRRLGLGFAGAAMLGMAGCALDPQLSPDATLSKQYETSPTLPNAVTLANSLRDQYARKVEDQILLDRTVGLLLIGAAGAAGGLAINSVSPDVILGLALGAGAGYTAATFLSSKPQQLIYAAGANAVQCALDAMHPMRIAYPRRDRLNELLRGSATTPSLRRQILSLQVLLAEFTAVSPPEVVRARAVAQQAKNLLSVAEEALAALDDAGGDLRTSLTSIQTQVTNAIITSSPNLATLAESLGKSLPSLGAKITGVTLPAPVSDKVTKSAGAEAKLVAPTETLESAVGEVETIVAAVRAKPATEKLKNCAVDLKQAGLTMRLEPAGEVPLDLTAAGSSTVTLGASGGVLPYRAAWLGRRPPSAQVDLKIESGLGLITVEAKKDAPAGSYVLLVQDSAQGRETSTIVIKSSAPQGSGKRAEASSTCPSDPEVAKVQKALIGKGVTTAQVDGKDQPLTEDGCLGPITTAAIRQFLKQQGVSDEDIAKIAKDAAKLLKSAKEALNV